MINGAGRFSVNLLVLIRSSENAWNYCGHLDYPLVAWLGLSVHHGRIHTHSPGNRDRGDIAACHSRSALVTNL